jgi:hypothetical protein
VFENLGGAQASRGGFKKASRGSQKVGKNPENIYISIVPVLFFWIKSSRQE